ncbi:MAG: Gx transporter family protein [Lachnospiraceae bacterium]|nr:Gx transporter family protein [Lachnospiraceae bacterium]
MKKDPVSFSKKAALNGLFIALAIILSYVESLIPVPFFIPGMKLGLANLAVMCALYLFDAKCAALVSLLRIIIIFLLFGNVTSLIFSLSGGMFSLLIMILLFKSRSFKTVTLSAVAGISHNLAQMLAALFVVKAVSFVRYTAILWFAGLLAGLVTGALCGVIINRIKKYGIDQKI